MISEGLPMLQCGMHVPLRRCVVAPFSVERRKSAACACCAGAYAAVRRAVNAPL
jgi:hypothetical protein